MISSIAAQTLAAAFKDSKDEHFISAALEFFDFTLDEISSFPGLLPTENFVTNWYK